MTDGEKKDLQEHEAAVARLNARTQIYPLPDTLPDRGGSPLSVALRIAKARNCNNHGRREGNALMYVR